MKNTKLIVALALVLVALMMVPAFADSFTGSISAGPVDIVAGTEYTIVINYSQDYSNSAYINGFLAYDADQFDVSASASDGFCDINTATGEFGAVFGSVPTSGTVTIKLTAKVDATGITAPSLSGVVLGLMDGSEIPFQTGTPPTDTPTDTATKTPSPNKTYNPGYDPDKDYDYIYGATATPVKDTGSVPATGDSMTWTYIAIAALGIAALGAVAAKKVFAK